jgi:hypothetical protein
MDLENLKIGDMIRYSPCYFDSIKDDIIWYKIDYEAPEAHYVFMFPIPLNEAKGKILSAVESGLYMYKYIKRAKEEKTLRLFTMHGRIPEKKEEERLWHRVDDLPF